MRLADKTSLNPCVVHQTDDDTPSDPNPAKRRKRWQTTTQEHVVEWRSHHSLI